jgi:HEAT repeat protein
MIEHLKNPDETARAGAVSRLGRLKAVRAVDPLAATLAGDSSPRVREAAAKALGMIGSVKALPALQRAAQNDSDRDVRHSAQFSVELVQAGR